MSKEQKEEYKVLVINGRFKIVINKDELLHPPTAFDQLREMIIEALKKTYFLKDFRETQGLDYPYPINATITELSQKVTSFPLSVFPERPAQTPAKGGESH